MYLELKFQSVCYLELWLWSYWVWKLILYTNLRLGGQFQSQLIHKSTMGRRVTSSIYFNEWWRVSRLVITLLHSLIQLERKNKSEPEYVFKWNFSLSRRYPILGVLKKYNRLGISFYFQHTTWHWTYGNFPPTNWRILWSFFWRLKEWWRYISSFVWHLHWFWISWQNSLDVVQTALRVDVFNKDLVVLDISS